MEGLLAWRLHLFHCIDDLGHQAWLLGDVPLHHLPQQELGVVTGLVALDERQLQAMQDSADVRELQLNRSLAASTELLSELRIKFRLDIGLQCS